jgi:hypothetical protein
MPDSLLTGHACLNLTETTFLKLEICHFSGSYCHFIAVCYADNTPSFSKEPVTLAFLPDFFIPSLMVLTFSVFLSHRLEERTVYF